MENVKENEEEWKGKERRKKGKENHKFKGRKD